MIKKSAFFLLIGSAVLSCALFIKTAVSRPFFSDSYLHLAIGKYIAVLQKVPAHYDISYKVADVSLEWFSHSWLSDLLLFSLTNTEHVAVSAVVTISFMCATLALLWTLFGMLKVKTSSRLLTIIIALFVAQIYWRIHPIIIITPLYIFTTLIYVSALQKKKVTYFAILPQIGRAHV